MLYVKDKELNMISDVQNGLEFDPGFAPYVLAFGGTMDYLYADINRFKNLSQKKFKFRQYYKKILDIFYNNLGFYIGCLMWAAYVQSQPEQELLNNHCLGQSYDEQSNVAETEFMIKFTELFPKDMKYFLNENFAFPDYVNKILSLYKEFLVINKGFVESKKTSDIKLPLDLKCHDVSSFKQEIEKVLKEEDLSKMLNYKDLICQE